ncbi:MAG: ATP-binding protein [Holdemanella biformis]|nr:ATP-binding protein [Holdemanella biformis]
MAINLLNIQPHKVSRDLSGFLVYIFGAGGTGKTTLASQMDRALLLAAERGYNAIPGVMAQDITSWSEMKQVVRELKKPEVKETFKSICIDTIDLMADYCEKYICNREGVEKLGDIPWGGGFKMMKKEFEDTFRTIAQMDYALFFISHSKDKLFKREDGTEYNQIVPSLSPSYNEIIRNMSDLQGYAHQTRLENGRPEVMLTLRSMDGSVECKSRFKYIEPEIPFSYEALSKALNDAIEKEAEKNGHQFVTDERAQVPMAPEYDFDELMGEFRKIIAQIQDATGDDFTKKWAPKITAITDKYLGKGKKVNDCTADQVEQLVLIVDDLKEAVGEGL